MTVIFQFRERPRVQRPVRRRPLERLSVATALRHSVARKKQRHRPINRTRMQPAGIVDTQVKSEPSIGHLAPSVTLSFVSVYTYIRQRGVDILDKSAIFRKFFLMQERRGLMRGTTISTRNRVDLRCGKSIIPEVRTLNPDSPVRRTINGVLR